jgi:hypothetical protein
LARQVGAFARHVLLHQVSDAGNNINFAPGSHIWFGSLDFVVVGKGYDLNLLPSTGEPTTFFEPADNLRLHSDELKGTWLDKFSYPSVPRVV